MTARKAGFVPYLIHWDDSAPPAPPPGRQGDPIGAGDHDRGRGERRGRRAGRRGQGHGARPADRDGGVALSASTIAETTTDAQGRWRVDDAPADLIGVNVQIQAPRFLRSGGPPSRNLDAVTVLKRGFTVKGRVLDAQGKPIAGAKVRGGDN